MPPTVKVKSDNDSVAKHREALAQRVIAHLGDTIPDLKLLCFFDDADWQPFKDHFGAANRAFYGPIKEDSFSWPVWPDYATDYTFVDDPTSFLWKRVFDHVIYLHGSTCANDLGLTMTFAHELQHFVQHSTVLKLWAANSLINRLPRDVINSLGLKWSDIPTEREARAVSKRTAEDLFGAESVRQYIATRITAAVNTNDAADWVFVQSVVASAPYDLAAETRLLFQRLRGRRPELEQLLVEAKTDPDFSDVDLDALFT